MLLFAQCTPIRQRLDIVQVNRSEVPHVLTEQIALLLHSAGRDFTIGASEYTLRRLAGHDKEIAELLDGTDVVR